MSKHSPDELALLKAIATSAIHIIEGGKYLRFVSPYLVEYEGSAPKRLWLPDLDFPFNAFVNDTSGDVEHNEKLWEKFNSEGRDKKDGGNLWEYIKTHESGTDVKVGNVIARLSGQDNGEFRIHTVKELRDYTVIVALAYQSCGTLFAALSFVVKGDTEAEKIKEMESAIEQYLKHVQKSRFLSFGSTLLMPTLTAEAWNNLRQYIRRYGVWHWLDDMNEYQNKFLADTSAILKPLHHDFGMSFKKALAADKSSGRPSIMEVLDCNNKTDRINNTLDLRVQALLRQKGVSVPYTIVVDKQEITDELGNEKSYDYLWFNVFAVADSIVGSIISYHDLVAKSPTHNDGRNAEDRLWINPLFKAHTGIQCNLKLKKNGETFDLSVSIHEIGLIGNRISARDGGGNHIAGIYKPAFLAGASEVFVEFLNVDGKNRIWMTDSSVGEFKDVSENRTSIGVPGFTGVWYVIQGKENGGCMELVLPEGNNNG